MKVLLINGSSRKECTYTALSKVAESLNEEGIETEIINLGGTPAGGKLKETGTSHWHNPNVGATNETNFTAIPSNPSTQNSIYISATWWSNTWDTGQSGPYIFGVQNADASANLSPCAATNTQKLSVRCIKD